MDRMNIILLGLLSLAVLGIIVAFASLVSADPAVPYDSDAVYDWMNCNGSFDSPLCNASYSCRDAVLSVNNTIFTEVDAVEENQATIQANQVAMNITLVATWDNMVNGSLASAVWSYASRTLSSVNWNVFTGWSWFSKYSHANSTVFYNYNSTVDRILINVTTLSLTSNGTNFTEIYRYDNYSYLTNVTFQGITS